MKFLRRDPADMLASQHNFVRHLARWWWLWLAGGVALAWRTGLALPPSPLYWLASALAGVVSYAALVRIDLRSRGATSLVFGMALFFLLPLAKLVGGGLGWASELHLAATMQYLAIAFAVWGAAAGLRRGQLLALQSELNDLLARLNEDEAQRPQRRHSVKPRPSRP